MKRTILLVAFGVAFVGVSLWLILSGGRSRRATRLKYRLGGAILSLVALTSTACGSGEHPMVSCYVPAPPPENYHRWDNGVANSELRNGDIVALSYTCQFGEDVTVSLISDDNDEDRVLCTETYSVKTGKNSLTFTIEAGDYRGRAKLRIEYVKWDDEDKIVHKYDIFVSIVD